MKKIEATVNAQGARSSGILLHISSLPGKYGIGTLGKSAYEFVDFLKKSGARYWQVLPLVQTGYGDSPYQSVCCISGNPYFIDPDMLYEQGLLTKAELKAATLPAGKVDYAAVYNTRYTMLRQAFARFDIKDKKFKKFVCGGKFDRYAEYMTLKQKFNNSCFIDWEEPYRLNDREVVGEYIAEHFDEYLFWQWLQFEFGEQWFALKKYANKNGISIIGDIPLYVAYDSADVWGMPELFKLDEDRKMTEVAGVPPDYFSADGQLWGNPLYDWESQKENGYAWWIARLKNALEIFDVIRVDHFRGLDRYFSIPNGMPNAKIGEWQHGPKAELFELAKKQLGEMNIIAEDLGILDEGVYKLLEDTAYPGMKILLFAFEGDETNAYLPANIGHNSICYTGTHDNDTAMGYFSRLDKDMTKLVKNNIKKALQSRGLELPLRGKKDMCEALLHMLYECDACLSIAPLQDILMLDNEYRMNMPSTTGNWTFRLKKIPTEETAAYVKTFVKKYHR